VPHHDDNIIVGEMAIGYEQFCSENKWHDDNIIVGEMVIGYKQFCSENKFSSSNMNFGVEVFDSGISSGALQH